MVAVFVKSTTKPVANG